MGIINNCRLGQTERAMLVPSGSYDIACLSFLLESARLANVKCRRLTQELFHVLHYVPYRVRLYLPAESAHIPAA